MYKNLGIDWPLFLIFILISFLFSTDELGIELAELWQQYLSFNAPEGNNEVHIR